jgi:hypothetical protein
MLYWAAVFLIIALVAAFLGFAGVATAPLESHKFCSMSSWSFFS